MTAVTRERTAGTTAVTRERSAGTTVTYRPREAPEVVTRDAVPAAVPTGRAARTSSATGSDRRQRSGPALAEQPKRKLLALDRFRGPRGGSETAPVNDAGGRRGPRVEAEQPRRRTLVNTDRFDGVGRFSRETWSEIKKVNWPDRETTRNLTLVVIAVSAILGVMLGGIDFVLFQLFEALP